MIMKLANGYILASPSYNYNVSAQMKTLIDRTFCLNDYSEKVWKPKLASGKKAIIIGVCKGKIKESMGYTLEAMKIPISELGVTVVEEIEYFDTKISPVENNTQIKKEILC